ncbi:TetR family transcriptional regulator [Parvibium lacunae]|uniref:TetR family transcriptional regulator n=1 Tax=Parvibium lacunae TaxID=1888893 RepID=A0A368KZZ6_9BURK|nr:TetR family transcriptional regulator [Parvibium lacunae]RCS56866.1 TetR family transcriptional regulator [Parvibium lacunae]
MARKTKAEAEVTYHKLLDAAEQLFCAQGVARTTLAQVAQHAGVTRGALYWHFTDKKALLHGLCDRAFLPMELLLAEMDQRSGLDPLAQIREISLHILTIITQDSRQRRVFEIIYHHCEKNDEFAFFVTERESRRKCLNQLEKIFKAAVASAQLPPETDTQLAMQAHHAYLVGLMHQWLLEPKGFSLRQHAPAMIDLFLAGLRLAPPIKAKAK